MKTTQPIFEDGSIVIRTPRLLLQSIQMSDLEYYNQMRSDPVTMLQSYSGFADADHNATTEYIQRWLPPNNLETLSLSIFETNCTSTATTEDHKTNTDDTVINENRFVGNVGVRRVDDGELETGYMIRRDYWGKGYATEALRAMLDYYWSLDRAPVECDDGWPELKSLQTVDPDGSVREGLRAMIATSNTGSRRVLEKCGFKLVDGKVYMPEPDHRGPETLIWYYLERPLP